MGRGEGNGPMIRVASYCRVSTDHEDQANSFASQKRFFQEYVSGHPEWELYKIYADEGITGTSTKKRICFLQMIQDAYEGRFQLILTKEVSRFSRNILDTIAYTRALKSIGVGVLFTSENLNTMDPESEMLLTFMGTIAQEESRRTSIRVKWGQTRRMEQGIVFGPSLLGYEVKNGGITKEPEGAELVRLIFYKYGIEKKGTSVICKELREAGLRTFSGSLKWSAGQIVKILKNEKYVGDLVQKKTITPDYLSHEKKKNRGEEELIILRDHHEAIIGRELWETVQRELSRRNKRGDAGKGASSRYAFSGKIKCGECGSVFVSRVRKKGDGGRVQRWGCYKAMTEGAVCKSDELGNAVGCSVGWLIRNDTVVSAAGSALRSLNLNREELIWETVKTVREMTREGDENVGKELARLEQEQSRLEQKKIKVLDAYVSGEITAEEKNDLRMRYENREVELQRRRRELSEWEDGGRERDEKMKIFLAALLSGEAESEILYKTLVREVIVFKDRSVELRFHHFPKAFIFTGSKGTTGNGQWIESVKNS